MSNYVKNPGFPRRYVGNSSATAKFSDRAEAEIGYSSPTVDIVEYEKNGRVLRFVRDASGTALTMADGSTWSPAGRTTLDHFGADCSGGSDVSSEFQAALAYSPVVYISTGTYLIDTPVVVEHDAKIFCGPNVNFIMGDGCAGDYCLSFIGGGSQASTNTTLTSSVLRGTRTLPVDDVSDYAPGDRFRLKSDEPAGTGVTGDSGFAAKTKGEYCIVEEIDGSNIITMSPIRDSYSTSGFTTSIRKMEMLEGVEVHGGHWVGAGGGGAAGNGNPDGPRAVYVEAATDVVLEGYSAENFGDELYHIRNVWGGYAKPVSVFGLDPADDSNDPMPTTFWSTGLQISSCQGFRYEGGHHQRLRRPCDPTTITGDILCRDITQIGCTFADCLQGIGTHQVDGFTATGNVGSCQKGIQFRGLNCSITGNSITLLGDDTETEYFIRVGSAPQDGDYTDETTAGRCVITGNTFLGSAEYGVLVQNSFEHLDVSGQSFPECRLNGFAVFAKQVGRFNVNGCHFGGIESYDSNSHVGFIANMELGPLERLDYFSAVGVSTTSKFRRGICVSGCGEGAGAGVILIDQLDLEWVNDREVFFQSTTSSPPGLAGMFSQPPRVGRVTNGNTSVSPKRVRPEGGGFAPVLPSALGNADIIASIDGTIASPLDGQNTYLAGQRLYYTDAGAGDAEGILITTSGTNGGTGGMTGSISSSSNELTVDADDEAFVGAYVTVAGAGVASADLVTTVVSREGAVATLADAASTTVADADVTYTQPTYKEFGAIEA